MLHARDTQGSAGNQPVAERCFGLVLCGGASRRMGRDKAQLSIGGQSLLERACAILTSGLTEEVILAVGGTRRPPSGHIQVLDRRPGAGPMAGLEAGLEAIVERHGSGWVCVLACDMPRVRPELFTSLLGAARAAAADVALFRTERGDEPLCAVYHTRVLDAVSTALDAGRRRMRDLFDTSGVLEPDGTRRLPRVVRRELEDCFCVHNVNTPTEFARMLSGESAARLGGATS